MKTSFLLSVIVASSLGITLFFLNQKKYESKIESKLNHWIFKNISEALCNRLKISTSDIYKALIEVNKSQINQEIYQSIESIELAFQRHKSPSKVDIILNINLNDSTSISNTKEVDWDELPSSIRRIFLETNKKNISVPWDLSSITNQ